MSASLDDFRSNLVKSFAWIVIASNTNAADRLMSPNAAKHDRCVIGMLRNKEDQAA